MKCDATWSVSVKVVLVRIVRSAIMMPCLRKLAEREKVALTYTSAIAWNSAIADETLWAKLHQHFSNPELVELGFFIGLTLGQQRWIKTLGIEHGAVLGDTTTGLAPTK